MRQIIKFRVLCVMVAFVLLAVMLTSTVGAAAKAEDCKACHDRVDHRQVELAGDSCNVCHDGTQHVAVNAGAQEVPAAAVSAKATTDLPSGMTVPMYYDTTRIGAEPNPMVRIPAGEFIMGTNERLPDEGPQHAVTLPEFEIDLYEVTNLQYKTFIDATGRRSPDHFRNRTYPPGKVDHPVTFVGWKDAAAYCGWAGKRLPSDREWEKAARGTDGRTFPWGNVFHMHAANTPVRWEELKQEGDTTPVGAFPEGRSPYGLYDVSGNVWEWTASWYKAYPGNDRQSENYGEKYRTLKGGSWWDCSFYKCGISAPVYNRSFFSPKVKNSSFGFRCARDVE